MTSQKIIYALTDPRTDETRYIGRSSSGLRRPTVHLTPSSVRKEATHKNSWIKSLLAIGIKPNIKVLHEFSDDATDAQLNKGEVWCIAHYRLCGAKLTNGNAGGEGQSNPSPETRRKISESTRNRSPEALRKMTGWVRTPETRKKMSESGKMRKPISEETRKRISQSGIGRKHPPRTLETIKRMSEAQMGKTPSLETRKKLSEALKGKSRSQDFIQNLRNAIRKDSTYGKGVSFDKRRNKFYSRISVDRKVIHLGYFDTLEEATQARLRAEAKYWTPHETT